jgi:hypothetical protein
MGGGGKSKNKNRAGEKDTISNGVRKKFLNLNIADIGAKNAF